MCTNRLTDPKTGLSYQCRKCQQCRSQAVNDVRLRLLAELRIAQARGWVGYFVTLTYGSDSMYEGEHRKNPRAQGFYWEDVKQWRQRLWDAGYLHRAYIVGEVGDTFGRVHWHLVVIFTYTADIPVTGFDVGRKVMVPPNIELTIPGLRDRNGKRVVNRYLHWLQVPERDRPRDDFIGPMPAIDVHAPSKRDWRDTSGGVPLWTHGWSVWEDLTDDAITYTTAYLLKNGRVGDTGVDGKGYMGRKYYGGTTRPPLGSDWFKYVLAPRYVEQGVPISMIVHFPEVRKWKKKINWADGKQVYEARRAEPFDFFLAPGATRRIFLDAYVTLWREKHGNDNWPQSDIVDAHVEDMDRRRRRAAGEPDETASDVIQSIALHHAERRGLEKLRQAYADQYELRRNLREAAGDLEVLLSSKATS